jgi:uncharacterized protein YbjT (DUF2867 family)
MTETTQTKPTLVLGGTGKTGRRIVDRLSARGGNNAYVTDDVQRALGRQPRDFGDYVRDTVATGVWAAPAADRVG